MALWRAAHTQLAGSRFPGWRPRWRGRSPPHSTMQYWSTKVLTPKRMSPCKPRLVSPRNTPCRRRESPPDRESHRSRCSKLPKPEADQCSRITSSSLTSSSHWRWTIVTALCLAHHAAPSKVKSICQCKKRCSMLRLQQQIMATRATCDTYEPLRCGALGRSQKCACIAPMVGLIKMPGR